MRVDELRKLLSKYEANELREIAVTLYKLVPKSKKEENDLDGLLTEFSISKAKPAKNDGPVEDFGALKGAVERFLEYAHLDYYFAPNNVVRKPERSKWRFVVRRFIKALLTVKGEDGAEAARLLAEVYAMLCYACHYYIFNTENPFSAVGYAQTDLLDITLGKMFYSGYDFITVRNAVFLTLDSTADRDTLHISLLYVLAGALKTPDTKEMALKQCLEYMNGYTAYQADKKRFKYPVEGKRDYRTREHINYAVELYLILNIGLFEYEKGIKFFWKYYTDHDDEIRLYILLSYYLRGDGLEALWLVEYEKAVKRGIEPRDTLQKAYEERKQVISR